MKIISCAWLLLLSTLTYGGNNTLVTGFPGLIKNAQTQINSVTSVWNKATVSNDFKSHVENKTSQMFKIVNTYKYHNWKKQSPQSIAQKIYVAGKVFYGIVAKEQTFSKTFKNAIAINIKNGDLISTYLNKDDIQKYLIYKVENKPFSIRDYGMAFKDMYGQLLGVLSCAAACIHFKNTAWFGLSVYAKKGKIGIKTSSLTAKISMPFELKTNFRFTNNFKFSVFFPIIFSNIWNTAKLDTGWSRYKTKGSINHEINLKASGSGWRRIYKIDSVNSYLDSKETISGTTGWKDIKFSAKACINILWWKKCKTVASKTVKANAITGVSSAATQNISVGGGSRRDNIRRFQERN